ncbi:hypothetical protein ACFQ1E_10615 [Sphingomonas canadensis]|uniref:Uncharacterized protein n=1 Tax=Sphingomonas canadensis TaxID=1219257 RepID=A0ABW3H5Q6_9SPHN|nr:hypothetical protein [Sphingomonas canadensis]MCW3836429.1 hypothetical protein [Sphingomonas canadensis]
MPRRLAAALAAALLFPFPALAQPMENVGSWSVFENPDNCRAITDLDDGTTAILTLRSDGEETDLGLTASPAFDVEDDEVEYIRIELLAGRTLLGDWRATYYEPFSDDMDARHETEKGSVLLGPLARADRIRATLNGATLLEMALKDTAALVPAIKDCVARVDAAAP